MKRYLLILVPAVAVVGLIVFMARAEDPKPGQLREKARQMQDLAEILRSQEKHQVANQLAENAQRLIHQAEEMEQQGERELPEQGEGEEQRRRDADRREHAAREADLDRRTDREEHAEREEHAQREEHRDGDVHVRPERREHHPAERRMQMIREATEHMHRAADLLREAEIGELAERLHREANRLEEEIGRQMQAENLHHVIGELREEVMRLRRDLENLKQHTRELGEHR